MKILSLVATLSIFSGLSAALTSDDCYNMGYNTGHNDAFNDIRGEGLIDGAAGLYQLPTLATLPGLTDRTAVENACTAEATFLAAYHRGFGAGYEGKVSDFGRLIYDLAYTESGGNIPPTPSSRQARHRRHAAARRDIREAHGDQW